MKEFELKYGCNPNQKPASIDMADGRDLPIVIASASPEFELRHAAKLLGVGHLIGTQCDMTTGELTGKNCKGEQKIARIREALGEFEVRAMYTDDAKADGPLLAIAQERYIVTHGQVKRI